MGPVQCSRVPWPDLESADVQLWHQHLPSD